MNEAASFGGSLATNHGFGTGQPLADDFRLPGTMGGRPVILLAWEALRRYALKGRNRWINWSADQASST